MPTGNLRLIIGFIQGIAIYILHSALQDKAWPATEPAIFAPLSLIVLFIPALVIVSLGHIRTRTLAMWVLAIAALLAGLGVHDALRQAVNIDNAHSMVVTATNTPLNTFSSQASPSFTLMLFVGIGLFIAESLLMAAVQDGRRIASYPRYFDVAWKLSIQFILSSIFTLVFWMVLGTGTALFALIKITFMAELLKHSWFNIPATTIAFSYALHITDVKVNLVRGIRTLKLTLLSWLLPIMTAFVAIFIISLPFKGIGLLWVTHHASQILLGAAAWIILLINAAYQDGSPEHRPGQVLRYSGIVGAILLFPLIAIAIYALFLRVNDHGWTVNLIDVFMCLIIALCYAAGDFLAAVSRGAWLQRLEKTNIYTSFAILIILLALFSPIADPAKLSVANQMARLKSGKVSADKFDYAYLKDQGVSYGVKALNQIKAEASGPEADSIKSRVDVALNRKNRWEPVNNKPAKKPEEIAADITVYPQGRILPNSFIKKDWAAYNGNRGIFFGCLTTQLNKYQSTKCDAFIMDTPNSSQQHIILANPGFGNAALFEAQGDDWVSEGNLSSLINCKVVRDALKAGEFKLISSTGQDLEVNGIRIRTIQNDVCPKEK